MDTKLLLQQYAEICEKYPSSAHPKVISFIETKIKEAEQGAIFMGVSAWKNYGKKNGYWDYFAQQERKIEHCSEQKCPACNTAAYEKGKEDGRNEADWHGENLMDAVESGKKQERENWKSILDSDSCECDNCHRTRRYLKDPKKELHKLEQRLQSEDSEAIYNLNQMKKVFYVETTTDGRTLLHCSMGENTGDVEIVEFPQDKVKEYQNKNKDCDCVFSISGGNICEKCRHNFYHGENGVLKTKPPHKK